jgi:hypothetical protein
VTILFSEMSQTFFLFFLLTRFTLTSSIHIQMFGLRRLIESTRERGREEDKVYTRVLSSVYDSRVNEILIWQKNLKSFQHENILFFYLIRSQSYSLYFIYLFEIDFCLKWAYCRYSIKMIVCVREDDNSIIDILCSTFSVIILMM